MFPVCPTVHHYLHKQFSNMTTHHSYPGSFSSRQIPKKHPTEPESGGLQWGWDISTLSKQSRGLWIQSILTPGEAQLEQHRPEGFSLTRSQSHPHALFFPVCSYTGIFPESSEDAQPSTMATRHQNKQLSFCGQAPINCHFQHVQKCFSIHFLSWETIWT